MEKEILSCLCYCLLLGLMTVVADPLKKNYQEYLEKPSVKIFQEYLRIDTSREENLKTAAEFWKHRANELDLPMVIYEPDGKPICVITVVGSDPSLPSIMLNSHMDVVPAAESEWSYPPFSGSMDDNGDIFGRGTQDTKAVAIQYLEAIRRLKAENITLLRTIHITLMPDEETGGDSGMRTFVQTKEFDSLNVGFALDEGLSSEYNELFATYVDKRPFQIMFTISGESGHGSELTDSSNAMEKLQKFINSVMKYRDQQKELIKSGNATDGTVTTININMIQGGVAPNVIPGNFSVVVDMRLSTSEEVHAIDALVHSWVSQTDCEMTLKYIRREEKSLATAVDDTNPFWTALRNAVNDTGRGYKLTPAVCPATSDMLYLRNKGVPALGFSTRTFTVSRLHAKNEYINVENFISGIDVYFKVIQYIANVQNPEGL